MKMPRGSRRRGQVALETAFMFSMMILMTFAIVNLGIFLHTKFLASYAAFMAGRSFQVLGDGTGSEFYKEALEKGGGFFASEAEQRLMQEIEDSKYPAFIRVAEDIFTCSLPWMSAPKEDRLEQQGNLSGTGTVGIEERCASGKRKYETLNIGEISFAPFDPSESNNKFGTGKSDQGLEKVMGGFAEQGREPLRYGILRLPFRTPIMFDPLKQFTSDYHQGTVYVPVLLNPGLKIQLEEAKDKVDADAAFKNSALQPSAEKK